MLSQLLLVISALSSPSAGEILCRGKGLIPDIAGATEEAGGLLYAPDPGGGGEEGTDVLPWSANTFPLLWQTGYLGRQTISLSTAGPNANVFTHAWAGAGATTAWIDPGTGDSFWMWTPQWRGETSIEYEARILSTYQAMLAAGWLPADDSYSVQGPQRDTTVKACYHLERNVTDPKGVTRTLYMTLEVTMEEGETSEEFAKRADDLVLTFLDQGWIASPKK